MNTENAIQSGFPNEVSRGTGGEAHQNFGRPRLAESMFALTKITEPNNINRTQQNKDDDTKEQLNIEKNDITPNTNLQTPTSESDSIKTISETSLEEKEEGPARQAVYVRFKEKEWSLIKKIAERMGLPRPEYLRRAALAKARREQPIAINVARQVNLSLLIMGNHLRVLQKEVSKSVVPNGTSLIEQLMKMVEDARTLVTGGVYGRS